MCLSRTPGVWYNSTGTEKCYNVSEEFVFCADPTGCGTGPAATAWDYQVCELEREGGRRDR